MGIFNFNKDAGEKMAAANEQIEQILNSRLPGVLEQYGLQVENPNIDFNSGVVTVTGEAADQATREKVVIALGNIKGVAQVEDNMTVSAREVETQEAAAIAAEPRFYTVKSGDSLSKIAKQYYGDAMKYPVIFDANKPMLKDPNLIYPGQVLRIPEVN